MYAKKKKNAATLMRTRAERFPARRDAQLAAGSHPHCTPSSDTRVGCRNRSAALAQTDVKAVHTQLEHGAGHTPTAAPEGEHRRRPWWGRGGQGAQGLDLQGEAAAGQGGESSRGVLPRAATWAPRGWMGPEPAPGRPRAPQTCTVQLCAGEPLNYL